MLFRSRSALDLPCAQGTATTAVRASARGRIGAPPRGAGAGVLLGTGGGQAPTLSSRPRKAEALDLTPPLPVTELFLLFTPIHPVRASWWLSGKESACNTGDAGSIPGSGKSPGEGNGNPLQYSWSGKNTWEIPRTEEPGGLQSMES